MPHGSRSRTAGRGEMEKGHAHTHRQNGHTTPGNAAHAGYTTATARAARQPPSRDAHRDTHAASLTRMQDPPCPAAQVDAHEAERSAAARKACNEQKKCDGHVEKRGRPAAKKELVALWRGDEAATRRRGAASAASAAQPQPLRSSGRARHDPSSKRHTSSCRAARAGGATRAYRSPLPAARALKV